MLVGLRSLRRHPYTWAGILFLLACLPLCIYKVWQNERHRTVSALMGIYGRRVLEMAIEDMHLGSIFDHLSDGHPHREYLERTLNRGEPFQTRVSDGPMEGAIFTDPKTGSEFAMLFVYGFLMHYEYKGKSRLPPLPRVPPEPPGWALGEAIRQPVANFTPAVWFVLLPVLALTRRWRFLAANMLLAVAVLAALSRVLDPAWFFPKNLLAPSVLLSLSVLALIWSSRTRPVPSGRLCSVCEYNLTGNKSGICPECGTPIPQAGHLETQ